MRCDVLDSCENIVRISYFSSYLFLEIVLSLINYHVKITSALN